MFLRDLSPPSRPLPHPGPQPSNPKCAHMETSSPSCCLPLAALASQPCSSPVTQRTPSPGDPDLVPPSAVPLYRRGENGEEHSSGRLLLATIPPLLPEASLPCLPESFPWRRRVPAPARPPEGRCTHSKLWAFIQHLLSELLLQICSHGYLLLLPPYSVLEACRVPPKPGGEPHRHRCVRTKDTGTGMAE